MLITNATLNSFIFISPAAPPATTVPLRAGQYRRSSARQPRREGEIPALRGKAPHVVLDKGRQCCLAGIHVTSEIADCGNRWVNRDRAATLLHIARHGKSRHARQ